MSSSTKATLPLTMSSPVFLRDAHVLLREKEEAPVLTWLDGEGFAYSEQAARIWAMVWRKSIQNGCSKTIHRWMQRHAPMELESWLDDFRLQPLEYLSSPNGWVGLEQSGVHLALHDNDVMSVLKRWTSDARQGARAIPTYQQNDLYRAKVLNVRINQKATVDFALRCASNTFHAVGWLSRGLSHGDSVLEWRAQYLSSLPERNTHLLAAMATSETMSGWMLASGPWHAAWEPVVNVWQEGRNWGGTRQMRSQQDVEYQDHLPMPDVFRVMLDMWPTSPKTSRPLQAQQFFQQAAAQAWFTLNATNEPLKEMALPVLALDL